jgi:hypothetical protein
MNSAVVGAWADRASTGVARESGARDAIATSAAAAARPNAAAAARALVLDLCIRCAFRSVWPGRERPGRRSHQRQWARSTASFIATSQHTVGIPIIPGFPLRRQAWAPEFECMATDELASVAFTADDGSTI